MVLFGGPCEKFWPWPRIEFAGLELESSLTSKLSALYSLENKEDFREVGAFDRPRHTKYKAHLVGS